MYGPQAAFISEQFTPRVRYTGSWLAYTLAGVIGGGFAPLVFTPLLARFQTWPWMAVYTAAASVVTLLGLRRGRDPHLEDEKKVAVG